MVCVGGEEAMAADRVREAFVEIVAKQKGCVLCDLAIGVLEEIVPEFAPGALKWAVVDVGARGGLLRLDQLTRIVGRRPSVPSIIINEDIAFDHIPDYDRLYQAVKCALEGPDLP
jgi:hypothetical protein